MEENNNISGSKDKHHSYLQLDFSSKDMCMIWTDWKERKKWIGSRQ